MPRSEEMQRLMKVLFPEQVERVEQGLCPFCGAKVDPGALRDDLSRKEFRISGLCQACQDATFRTEDDLTAEDQIEDEEVTQ